MNITLKAHSGYELIFEAENVRVTEDVEERTYTKGEDGKIDFKIPVKRDIQTAVLEQFVAVLDDLIYYRYDEFNSSPLIERLFTKLSEADAKKLITELNKEYEITE